jgi:hypothetical protein
LTGYQQLDWASATFQSNGSIYAKDADGSARFENNFGYGHQAKLRDTLRVAGVTVKGRDPISATSVVWMMENGYIPEFRDHQYHGGELVLPDWNMGWYYRQTSLGAIGTRRISIAIQILLPEGRGYPEWPCIMGSNKNLVRLKTKTLHRIIDLIFKLAGEPFDMSQFPKSFRHWARDSGRSSSRYKIYLSPSSGGLLQQKARLIWYMRHQRNTSPRALRGSGSMRRSWETTWIHMNVQRSPGDWLKFMMKTGSEQSFPNIATARAINAIESARVLMRSRQGGVNFRREADTIGGMGSDMIFIFEHWRGWKWERLRETQSIIWRSAANDGTTAARMGMTRMHMDRARSQEEHNRSGGG